MKKTNKKLDKILPIILIILDGWGVDKPNKGNAITLAKTPTIDGLSKKYPYTEICAHGKCVGLPPNQVGNSEAGHMNIGAGRIVEQDIVRISKSINNGSFFNNIAFKEAIRHVKNNNSNLHIMGMLSNGQSPHSDPDHMIALVEMAKQNGIEETYLHLFTDGRDSPQYASLKLIEDIERCYFSGKKVATIMGRFYAMDRKKKWERTEKAYNALVLGEGEKVDKAYEAITKSYNSGLTDEFIKPYIITRRGKPLPRISDNDSVIFFNLRSDRARQLAKVFVQKDFNKRNPGSFKRKKVLKNLSFIAMTDFGPDLDSILSAFPSPDLKDTLPMLLYNYKHLYIAETEKWAHVTYFFNGGYDKKVNHEDTFMVPSPDVKSYDETPAMSTKELTAKILKNLDGKKYKYDFTLLNIAAPDMVAHTGNLQASIQCCEEIDGYVKKIVEAYLKKKGTVLITADHGNIEGLINLETGEKDTQHSTKPVPFILVNNELRKSIKLRKKKTVLGDIAPTILELMNVKKPKAMTGKSLIK